MDPTGKEEPHLGTDEQGASRIKWKHSQFAVRAADMTDDLGKLLDWGLEEHFRGR
ncbi:hypothetical protein [Pseudophaeobacter profundi]|jgi:hypothetical protein|uniref:hypothetical protein n=1 Tax=Pseudophaeobacter profundi TaxID=3034152 RepID=UPI00242D6467|nr:hypothetical protein [Pseudophaeobacter profundi]